MKSTIIDLGCGTGNELKRYYGRYNVVGVDIDKENIKICQGNMPDGEWKTADITRFPVAKYTNIKKIICTEVLEHMPNWQRVIQNLSQVAKGTKLLITVPYATSENKLIYLRPEYWQEIGHKHFFSGHELKKDLRRHGWDDIKIKRINAALYFELKRLFKKNAPCIRNTYYKNILSLPEKIFWQLLRPSLFQTKLKYFFPIWIITLPIGKILDRYWGAGIEVTAKKH